MTAWINQPVFSTPQTTYRWRDVILLAQFYGFWTAFHQRLAAGLVCVQRASSAGELPSASELEEAGNAFRYERDLISAAEFEAWLAEWHMSVSSWVDYLAREVTTRGKWKSDLPELTSEYSVGQDELEQHFTAEAVCSQQFPNWCMQLAARAAAACQVSDHPRELLRDVDWQQWGSRLPNWPDLGDTGERTLREVMRLDWAYDEIKKHVASHEGLEKQVQYHDLEWTCVEGYLARFDRDEVAEEAAWCVRADGEPLEMATRRGRGSLQFVRIYVCDADPEFGGMLLSSRENELLGPTHVDGLPTLLLPRRKLRPTLGDAEIRRRAEHAALEEALIPEMDRHIHWHVHW